MDDFTSGMDWGEYAAGIADKLLDATIAASVSNPHEIEKLKINRLGSSGYYDEGTRKVSKTIAGVPTSALLLLGAGVVAWLLLKG
jgi:hypothetical protein